MMKLDITQRCVLQEIQEACSVPMPICCWLDRIDCIVIHLPKEDRYNVVAELKRLNAARNAYKMAKRALEMEEMQRHWARLHG